MTPDANDLCVFAIKRGNIEKRLDINYNLPQYAQLVSALRAKFGNKLKRIGDIADVICGPFGSAIKTSDYQETGIPLVRITNITKDGYMDYSDMVYIPEELGNSLSRTQVSKGDIVISQRGSLGQCAVVDDAFPVQNISANVIAIKNITEVSAQFIHDYLLSTIGQKLLERSTSGQVQQKITTQDIADITIPISDNEKILTDILFAAHLTSIKRGKKAKTLLSDLEQKILGYCHLPNTQTTKLCYAVRLIQLNGVIDAKRYISPVIHSAFTIGDYCDIIEEKVNISKLTDQQIDWIRIDDLTNNPLEITSLRTLPSKEMDGVFYQVNEGDILVARLGPTILNQKIVMVRTVQRVTMASAEFLVLRCKEGYSAEAIMAILRTSYYRDLMYSYARGSTPSRYRLSREDAIKLPFPDIAMIQKEIESEAINTYRNVTDLQVDAINEWANAKAQFEKELLGEI